jgi:hypothetical protein
MELGRRDLPKVGIFGSAAVILPAERVARSMLAMADRIAESRLLRPSTVPFAGFPRRRCTARGLGQRPPPPRAPSSTRRLT